MAYEIVWTENARQDLWEIVSYLEGEWSLKIAERFILEVLQKIDIISSFTNIN